jgi:hypothetical protein
VSPENSKPARLRIEEVVEIVHPGQNGGGNNLMDAKVSLPCPGFDGGIIIQPF